MTNSKFLTANALIAEAYYKMNEDAAKAAAPKAVKTGKNSVVSQKNTTAPTAKAKKTTVIPQKKATVVPKAKTAKKPIPGNELIDGKYWPDGNEDCKSDEEVEKEWSAQQKKKPTVRESDENDAARIENEKKETLNYILKDRDFQNSYQKYMGSLDGFEDYVRGHLDHWFENPNCNGGEGFCPYLDKPYMDYSWLRVGDKIINIDDMWMEFDSSLSEEAKQSSIEVGESENRMGELHADPVEVFTIEVFDAENEEELTAMEFAHNYYDVDDAVEAAKEAYEKYKDSGSKIEVRVFGGEEERENGEIYGEPDVWFTVRDGRVYDISGKDVTDDNSEDDDSSNPKDLGIGDDGDVSSAMSNYHESEEDEGIKFDGTFTVSINMGSDASLCGSDAPYELERIFKKYLGSAESCEGYLFDEAKTPIHSINGNKVGYIEYGGGSVSMGESKNDNTDTLAEFRDFVGGRDSSFNMMEDLGSEEYEQVYIDYNPKTDSFDFGTGATNAGLIVDGSKKYDHDSTMQLNMEDLYQHILDFYRERMSKETAVGESIDSYEDVVVFDNGGDIGKNYQVSDRYTVWFGSFGGATYRCSANANMPNGVSYYDDDRTLEELENEPSVGEKVPFETLPDGLKRWIDSTYRSLDEESKGETD